MAVRGGLTRFARPKGQPARCASGLSNGQLPVVEPRSEVLIPPAGCYMRKKSPHLYASFSSNMAVRGGLTRFARPKGQPARCASGLSNGQLPVVEPRSEVLIPPSENIKEKSPYLRTGSHLKYGGEGGIRTPDTLPYTHFPGVLLQPLGHLTILSSRCYRDGR